MSVIGAIGFMVTAGLLFNIVFSSKDDFVNCLKYYFTPDVWSLLKGEFHQDFFAEGKILIWLVLSALVGYGMHQAFV